MVRVEVGYCSGRKDPMNLRDSGRKGVGLPFLRVQAYFRTQEVA